eukprot:m.234007 g.234007  ORF g.234007 m.234007 type:complete len:176 (-) comp22465_c1_seq2:27-554(-)
MTDKRITSHSHLAAGSTSQLAVASPRMHRAGELLNGIGKKMVPSFLRKKNERDKDEEAEEDDNSEPPSRAITRVPTVEVEDEQKSTSNPGVHSEQKRSHSIRSTGSTDSSRRKSKAKVCCCVELFSHLPSEPTKIYALASLEINDALLYFPLVYFFPPLPLHWTLSLSANYLLLR